MNDVNSIKYDYNNVNHSWSQLVANKFLILRFSQIDNKKTKLRMTCNHHYIPEKLMRKIKNWLIC